MYLALYINAFNSSLAYMASKLVKICFCSIPGTALAYNEVGGRVDVGYEETTVATFLISHVPWGN